MSVRTDRLRQLADHLLSGKLGHREFAFWSFNTGPKRFFHDFEINDRLKNCGSKGCAIGECPFVFKEWYFDRMWQPVCSPSLTTEMSAREFFGLDHWQYSNLFIPYDYDRHGERKNQLEKTASAEEVAKHILKFCKEIEKVYGTYPAPKENKAK